MPLYRSITAQLHRQIWLRVLTKRPYLLRSQVMDALDDKQPPKAELHLVI
jgi:hypothetical protein